MCDLIDLNSPAGRPLNTILASPLIPVPPNIEHGNVNICNDSENLDNNPFDKALHEAIEYERKREDPFEIVFEKTVKKDETVILENKNVNVTDDLKAVCTQFSQKTKEGKNLPTIEVTSMDLSILNQSAMNDTLLYETNCNKEEDEIKRMDQQKIPLHTQTIGNNIENIPIDIKLVSSKCIRSHSENDIMQECKQCLKHRSKSAIETLRAGKISTSDLDSPSSTGFSDTLNKGFLSNQYSDISVFSTFSNISNITRPNSTSLTCNSVSSSISNNTMNQAFLNSNDSEVFCDARLNRRMNNTMNTVSVSPETSLPIIPVQTQFDISILGQKLNDVKMKLPKSQILETENTERDYLSGEILNNTDPYLKTAKTKIDIDDKLLGINGCVYESTSSTSGSDGSCESVFLENIKVNKLILNEAKALARIFEDIAAQSVSGSGLDEFIINDPTWPLELLPAFEDEIEDDLVELLSSPNVAKNIKRTDKEESSNVILSDESSTQNNFNNIKFQNNITKETEISPSSPIAVDKKAASTLLLDLKKTFKAENNSEANKLLQNLEKILGIRSDNNIELVSTYLQTTNYPSKNHQNCVTRSEMIKNSEDEKYVNKNHVDDSDIYKIEINEDLYHNDKIHNEIDNEALNDSKRLMVMENEVQSVPLSANECREPSSKKETSSVHTRKKKNNVDISHSTPTNINKNEEENNKTEVNEKVAVELLINLGKVLSGQLEKSATVNLLKNLGEVLHLVSKNKEEKSIETDDVPWINAERTEVENKLKTGKKVQSLMPSKLNHRKSLDLVSKEKTSNGKVFRKSKSISSTPPEKKLQSTLLYKNNSNTQLKETSKRFSSDPGLLNLGSYKKGVAVSTGDLRKDIQQVKKETNNQKEKPSIKLVVKNQLKSKTKYEVVNKKGPMKAVIPIGNMQRKGIVTPPKSLKNIQSAVKICNSTPNYMENGSTLKKSPKSKPMASSTPGTPKCKSVMQLPVLQHNNKLNVSCDISPINIHEETPTNKCRVYLSPNRTSKCPSPRRVTPKNQLKESSIPTYSTSPGIRVRHSSYEKNKSGPIIDPSQVSAEGEENVYKRSPIICKRIGISQQKSPLKDSNTIITKAKPLNLTSKLRRNGNESIGSGKENIIL